SSRSPGLYSFPTRRSSDLKKALEITGHRVIGWNVRSYDAIINSEKLILNRILSKIKPGDVILMHDTNEDTVEILEQLLLFLRSRSEEHTSELQSRENLVCR